MKIKIGTSETKPYNRSPDARATKKSIYDNSNIAESYAGTTTPLTFSFVSLVYTGVYTHFSKLMGVSKKDIEKNSEMYQNMVVFIGNRIYYNLSNWYKMLQLFPMYKFSSEFMEKMMGVRESIEKVEPKKGVATKLITFPINAYLFVRIFTNFALLRYTMPIFSKKFFDIYHDLDNKNIKNRSIKELLELFDAAAKKLLHNWKIPIANDFSVMVSTGLADKLYIKWCKKNNSYEYMKSRKSTPISTLDPGSRLLEIKKLITNDKSTLNILLTNSEIDFNTFAQETTNKMAISKIRDYLLKYSYRVPNELKLETLTMKENPKKIFKVIRSYVLGKPTSVNPSERTQLSSETIKISFPKRFVLNFLLRWSATSISRREEARYLRTLIFGFVRKLFLEIGEKLYEENILDDSRDIFYLKIEELRLLADNKTSVDTKRLILERKITKDRWHQIKCPGRIESDETLDEIESQIVKKTGELKENLDTEENSDTTSGRVASQPKNLDEISGSVVVLKEFDSSADFENKILITTHTDPGWTIIFPLLRGIIVERGGILSHAAIVARELNIPCVVGVQNATDIFSTGEDIKIDMVGGNVCKTKS